MGFWKKLGIGAAIGVTFGVTAAAGFLGIKTVAEKILPNTHFSAEFEAEEIKGGDDKNEAKEEKKAESTQTKKVENATLTKAVDTVVNDPEAGMSVTELAKNNLPSVVSITNTSVQTLRDIWGRSGQYQNVSRGSGIIIGQTDDELLIATNSHVVSDSVSITVGFIDDEIYDATVKGADKYIDLAVIGVKMSDIKQDTLDQIKVAVIGDSDSLQVGEQVVAIGNAIGYGQSVTTGIVSALNRDIPDDDVDTAYIQTDAAINPGNSGGALLNMKGEVIGINAAKIASTYVEGIGYAIPMNVAEPTIDTLMNRTAREKVDEDKAGYLGITGVSVDASTSKMYGIPEGIYLQEVIEDGPAEEAGLLKGDIIKKFDGISVSSIAELRENMDYYEAGEKVDVEFCRQEDGEYKEKTVSVTLTTKDKVGIKDERSEEKDTEKREGEPEGNGEERENSNGEDPGRDYYNSLPDELKEFFFGFGR